jgi:hypothetical protein
MKKAKLYIAVLSLSALLGSCTKVIDIQTANDTGQLDIEANVVDTLGVQTITLTKNVPFTSTNVYPAVTGATVTVTAPSGTSYRFTEGASGIYTSNTFKGISGDYKMTVLTGSKTYNATSTLPVKVTLDSVTSQNRAVSTGSNPKKQIVVHYKDPAGVANYYRFVMYLNGVQVKSVFAFNDEFNDGLSVNNILRVTDSDFDIYAGDKVRLEMQCIDAAMYLYWHTLAQQSGGVGGGVTPSNPPTNISPESLGYFSAHTTQTITITVK